MDLCMLILMLVLLYPNMASAYLDPSAGNALVYIAITLVSVFIYAIKGVFYRITGKNIDNARIKNDIVIFSEGKNYWNTFEPIINALIDKEQAFGFYTMDIEDPGLKIRNHLMHSRYIGSGSAAYAKINRISCRIMVSTTPNIGTPGYPLPRPAKTGFLFHVFHDPDGIAYYKKNALDFYDGVCTVGDYAKPAIRYLEELRNLPKKELVSLGLPYWDILLKNSKQIKKSQIIRKVVLLAPSWGEKGFISNYDVNFIIKELISDFDIIFRPHPQSRKVEPAILDQIQKTVMQYGGMWDENPDPSHSLSISDVLISDTSAIRLDYAVIYKKPVISLEVKVENLSSYELCDLPLGLRSFADKVCTPINDVTNINSIVKEALINKEVFNTFIRDNIANLGSAGEHIAEYLIAKLEQKHV